MDSCSDREILGTHTVAAGESSWKIYNGVETNGLTRKLSVMLLNFPGFSGGGCTDSLGQGQAGDKGSKRVASNGIQTGFERKPRGLRSEREAVGQTANRTGQTACQRPHLGSSENAARFRKNACDKAGF